MGEGRPPGPFPLKLLPLGFYDRPAPDGIPGLQSMPVPDWLVIDDELQVDTPERMAHRAVSSWKTLLDDLPPLFPL
jgi:hypothetical protein